MDSAAARSMPAAGGGCAAEQGGVHHGQGRPDAQQEPEPAEEVGAGVLLQPHGEELPHPDRQLEHPQESAHRSRNEL